MNAICDRCNKQFVVQAPHDWDCPYCSNTGHPSLGSPKPQRRKVFPAGYVGLYGIIAEAAHEMGYAVGIHGSLARDLDLVAVPWTGGAVSNGELVVELCRRIGVWAYSELEQEGMCLPPGAVNGPTEKPHGRRSWSIQLGCGAYLDLSVLPLREEG